MEALSAVEAAAFIFFLANSIANRESQTKGKSEWCSLIERESEYEVSWRQAEAWEGGSKGKTQ